MTSDSGVLLASHAKLDAFGACCARSRVVDAGDCCVIDRSNGCTGILGDDGCAFHIWS